MCHLHRGFFFIIRHYTVWWQLLLVKKYLKSWWSELAALSDFSLLTNPLRNPGYESVSDLKFFQCSKQEHPMGPVETLFCIYSDNYGPQMVHTSIDQCYWSIARQMLFIYDKIAISEKEADWYSRVKTSLTVFDMNSFSLWCLVCLPVPIIPSYLYSLDESAVLKNNTPHEQAPKDKFHSIVSLYDNSVRSFSSNTTASSTTASNSAELPPNSSDCPQSSSLLINENVKVGMLFASKATVQLITNPFVGPLTNRYVFVFPWSDQYIV